MIRQIQANNQRWRRIEKQKYLLNNSNEFEEKIEVYIDNLLFNKETNFLQFKTIKKTTKPKITQYVTRNYVRTPIYGDVSVRTAVIKNFNKIINPLKFVFQDILELNLEKEFILKIIDEIGIIPKWREKEIKLEIITNEIAQNNDKLRNYELEKKQYNFKKIDYPEKPSNFWLRLFFAPITLFFSFWGFLSKNNAQLNIMTNKKHQEYNFNHKEEINLYNDHLQKNINRHNEKINIKNNLLYEKYLKVKNEEINLVVVIEDDWINLRQASNFTYDNLENKKGVYIIWNKTKNIYYVGQSKNMKKRLNNHFKNGDVNNIIFAKDWYNNDEFYYKYYFCYTKDELDLLEKKYIELYNSFENGYNKTGGNK